MNPLIAHPSGLSCSVAFAADQVLEIGGQKLRADISTAYMEIYLAHSFPVRTVDGTSIHPQVVANSYQSMLNKPFDFLHQIKSYNPDEFPRDRIIGAIVAVEFPQTPMGGWRVGDPSRANYLGGKQEPPSIRAAAAVFKAAEGVSRVLGEHQSGRRKWTVSMENKYYLDTSGFLVGNSDGKMEGDETPDEFAALGLAYYPALTAPDSLLSCFDTKQSKVMKKWKGREVTALLGGLAGSVHFQGVGITPEGKEREAEIATVLASEAKGESPFEPLEKMLRLMTGENVNYGNKEK